MEISAFKSVMASFPSGVAVVSVIDADGSPRGLTCSALCSVSLEPAMLLICVGKTSSTLPVLRERGAFVVNFLAENTGDVAYICASKATDKFAGLHWRASSRAHGAPILTDHIVAYAECTIHNVVEAGDHLVLIAKVEDGAVCPKRMPLVHARGRIEQLAGSEAQAA